MDKKLLMLAAACVIVCLLAGGIGSVFTMPSIPTWYASLNKPSFSPPNWLFGPVWTLLYVMMGVAVALVLAKGLKKKGVTVAVELFAIQLLLNVFWSFAFFGMRSPFFGFFVIVVLWVTILATTWEFWRISKKAAWLMVPYILWVSFASLLNLAVAVMNP